MYSEAEVRRAKHSRTPSRQPRFGRTVYREETFDQRRERARHLPAAYAAGWAHFLSDVMEMIELRGVLCLRILDQGRMGTRLLGDRAADSARVPIRDVRHVPTPESRLAESHSRVHWHGCNCDTGAEARRRAACAWILADPSSGTAAQCSLVTVQTNGHNVEIVAPMGVTLFTRYLRAFSRGPSSFHLDYRDGAAVDIAADVNRVGKS